jgi:hypothetical protein
LKWRLPIGQQWQWSMTSGRVGSNKGKLWHMHFEGFAIAEVIQRPRFFTDAPRHARPKPAAGLFLVQRQNGVSERRHRRHQAATCGNVMFQDE